MVVADSVGIYNWKQYFLFHNNCMHYNTKLIHFDDFSLYVLFDYDILAFNKVLDLLVC